MSCDTKNLGDVFRGMALAIQKDKNDFTSDCYLHTDKSIFNLEGIFQSVQDLTKATFSKPEDHPARIKEKGYNLLLPVQWWNTFLIELSDSIVACDVNTMMKQLSFRTQYISGLQDSVFVLFSACFGFLAEYNPFLRNELYDALSPIFNWLYFTNDPNAALSCSQIGFALGQIPSAVLNFRAPDEVFYTNVNDYDFDKITPIF